MASKIRDRIVSNAVRCFAERGYSGCSTKDIAARADVTEGSLFRLCESKENLFTEALSAALGSRKVRRMHQRLVAFALLERKGLTGQNMKSIRGFAGKSPAIKELRAIS